MQESYDIIIIGAGPAGYHTAIKLAEKGKKTALIDKSHKNVGGVCLNEGCIPTKALLNLSNIYSTINSSKELGFNFENKSINLQKMYEKISSSQTQLQDGLFLLFKKNGIDFIEGVAEIEKKGIVKIKTANEEKNIFSKDIIISIGSHPSGIKELTFNHKDIISSKDALTLSSIPKNILIVGGGAIGVEFAEIFNDLESNVTIIEMEKTILPREDTDTSKHLSMYLKKKGINIFNSSKILKAEKQDNGYEVTIESQNGEKKLFYDTILIATGRKPNTISPNFIQYKNGFIPTDTATKKYSENIYAIGDVTTGPMLAHKAYFDADIAVNTILGKKVNIIDHCWIPRITYSHIETASIGLTETEIKNKNIPYKTVKHFFKANGKAVSFGTDTGFIKIITDEEGSSLLGAHIFGIDAGELIHILLTAQTSKMNINELKNIPFAHPTYSEIIKEACEKL